MSSRRDFLALALWTPLASSAAAVPKFAAYPFSLGVASGYPMSDSVVLWTRLAPSLAGGGMDPEPRLGRLPGGARAAGEIDRRAPPREPGDPRRRRALRGPRRRACASGRIGLREGRGGIRLHLDHLAGKRDPERNGHPPPQSPHPPCRQPHARLPRDRDRRRRGAGAGARRG